MSLREFARLRRVTEGAVRKAVRSGRLERSIAYSDGVPFIHDARLAHQEWKGNYDPTWERRR